MIFVCTLSLVIYLGASMWLIVLNFAASTVHEYLGHNLDAYTKYKEGIGMEGSSGYRRKTWTERMNTGKMAEFKITDTQLTDVPQGSLMLITTPVMVDAAIREILPGKYMTPLELRKAMALAYQADTTCPVSFGMNLRIVAEAAYEQFLRGMPSANITPVWRIIGPESPTARRASFPIEFLLDRRTEEELLEATPQE